MDMTSANSTNGVDRYLSCLIEGLENYAYIRVHWINLLSNASFLFHKTEIIGHYTKVTIPLPQRSGEIIGEYFWVDKYNELVYGFVASLFENKENVIIHIHTLNLIDLAECIKRHVPAQIITHLHCIPWKNLYNSSSPKFDNLYRKYYLAEAECEYTDFVSSPSEKRSYDCADKIITVTNCAKEYLFRVMKVPEEKIAVIPNGMEDQCLEVVFNTITEQVDLLFVGAIAPGKGIFYILEALQLVCKEGYNVWLHVAGFAYPEVIRFILTKYKDVPLNLLGSVPFSVLKKYYASSHIGLIASLYEQSSYVAVEMSMFGLPLVVTAVDGLDELFTDGLNALKVQTTYQRTEGLRIDVTRMKDKIIELIQDENKRRCLSANIRNLYEEHLTAERMVSQVVRLYSELSLKIE